MEYQRCARCVMDNKGDSTITFDENGYCNYCTETLALKEKEYFPNEIGKEKLEAALVDIKKRNKNKKYDCVMGISGGLDSSYLAYMGAKKWGLRILGFHIDDGFDTDIAKRNVENLVKACNIKLITIKPDAEQFYELTRAYIYAEVPNLAVPQDSVLFATLYAAMKKEKIYDFLIGGNFALECILQNGNTWNYADKTNVKAINKRFGRAKINKLKLMSVWQERFYNLNKNKHAIRKHRFLNYIDYNRDNAIKQLYEFCGYEYYDAKHLENELTKFIQVYWFYKKFDVDKRKSHLSSMIVSGQMTRQKALAELEKPAYDVEDMEKTIEKLLTIFDIPRKDFDEIMSRPGKQHNDYPYYKEPLYKLIIALKKRLR